jgi:hypothetical protein
MTVISPRGIVAGGALCLLPACGGGDTGTGEDDNGTRHVAFASASLTMGTGDSVPLAAEVRDAKNRVVSSAAVSYRVLDEQVATSRGGRLVALRAGSARVVGESEGATPDTLAVNVALRVTGVILVSADTLTLSSRADTIGLGARATAGLDVDPNAPIVWRVLDTAVAQVGADGRLWGVHGGVTRVVAASGDGAFADTAVVLAPQRLVVPATMVTSPYTDATAPARLATTFAPATPFQVTATSDDPQVMPSFQLTVPAGDAGVALPTHTLAAGRVTLRFGAPGVGGDSTVVTSSRVRVGHGRSLPHTQQDLAVHTLEVIPVTGLWLEASGPQVAVRQTSPLTIRLSQTAPAIAELPDSVVIRPSVANAIEVRSRALGAAWVRISGPDVVPDSFPLRTTTLPISIDGSLNPGVGQETMVAVKTGYFLADSFEFDIHAVRGNVRLPVTHGWVKRTRNPGDSFWTQELLVPVHGVTLGVDTLVASGAFTGTAKRAITVEEAQFSDGVVQYLAPISVGTTRSGLTLRTFPAWPPDTLRVQVTSSDPSVLTVSPAEVLVSPRSPQSTPFSVTGVAPGSAHLIYTAPGYPALHTGTVTVVAP